MRDYVVGDELVRYRVLRTGLTLLLSATVFLGSVMPPAVQHAHGGVDQAHNHKATPTAHTHSHPHRHSHPHQSKPQKKLATLPTWHRHITLFGWDFHLASSDSPNGSSPRSCDLNDQIETLVRLFETNFVVASAPSFDWVNIGLPLVMGCAAIEYDGVISSFDRHVRASLPLCDAARGERSGVLVV